MEFTIENFIWKNDGLFGEDTVSFEFDVITDEPIPYSFPCSIGMHTLLKYIAETNPELVDYIKKIRSSIDGWGPKEGRLMNELDDAIDFKTIIYDLFQRKGWFVSEYERWKKLRAMTPEEHQKIDKVAEELSAHGSEMIRSTKNYYDFCESADKALHAIAIRIYPEILDMDKEKVKAFKYLFTSSIQDMQKILVKLPVNKKTRQEKISIETWT